MPFYISLDGSEKQGPYGIDDLEQLIIAGELLPHSLVWRPGLTEWTKASDLSELNFLFVNAPPPLKPRPPIEEPPIPSSVKTFSDDMRPVKYETAMYRFFRKLFKVHGTYLSGWDFFWVSLVRFLLCLALFEFGLVLFLGGESGHQAAEIAGYEISSNILKPWNYLTADEFSGWYGMVAFMIYIFYDSLSKFQRALSVGGTQLRGQIILLDILFFAIGAISAPTSGGSTFAESVCEVYFGISWLFLFSDSYSPDKGGGAYLWDHLRVSNKSKQSSLRDLLRGRSRMISRYNIPSDVVVVPRCSIPGSTDECQDVYKNEYYYLAVMHRKKAFAIHEWTSLSQDEKTRCYRKSGGFESIDSALDYLTTRAGDT